MSCIGSPPLTRELPPVSFFFISSSGITPAYAGTTKRIRKRKIREEDHPRLRGNYRFVITINVTFIGSPPLTRELLNEETGEVDNCGITPAYAGTTEKR